MSIRPRQTLPVDTIAGVVETYAQHEPQLAAADVRGRLWIFEAAVALRPFDEQLVFDLHHAMFEPLFDWAGTPRTGAFGPGGIEHVRYFEVRAEVRKLAGDFAAWLTGVSAEPTPAEIAVVTADLHHRMQWIHPFKDTNGRTGRVLDHFVLWSCFGLRLGTPETSPTIQHFPDEDAHARYLEGLHDADNHRMGKLREYYTERITACLSD